MRTAMHLGVAAGVLAAAAAWAGEGEWPRVGLGDYTRAHAANPAPPDRWGGALVVEAVQKRGAAQWALPGPRALDPAVFGTPAHPTGWDPAPFPLAGVPVGMRQSQDGRYTIVDHATPFSDWRVIGVGDVRMRLVDRTAIDGATTKDEVHFEAEFDAPDKSHHYKVVARKPLAHGIAFPTFGGVVTNHLLHGVTGIGTRLMPTEFTYAAFWAVGDVYVDGKLTNPDQLVHVMVTEGVRGKGWRLGFDKDIHGEGVVMHLMVPPFRVTPKGLVRAPVRSGYLPFAEIKKRLMQAMAEAKRLPPEARKQAMARLEAEKALMARTKAHVRKAMAAGKMWGQPFFHVMFGNVEYKAAHE